MAPSTSNSSPNLPIILYHYPYSPYARRITWYLQLRGIPYLQCVCFYFSFSFSLLPLLPLLSHIVFAAAPPSYALISHIYLLTYSPDPTPDPPPPGPLLPARNLLPPHPPPQHRPRRVPGHEIDPAQARVPPQHCWWWCQTAPGRWPRHV